METNPTVRMVAVADVRVPDGRLRALGDVEALRESIASAGLLQPIVVDRSLTLVCGHHRLEACRQLGWTSIPAVVEALEGPRARLAEVDENLCRRELTVLERAEHIALRRALWEEMHRAAAPEPEGKKRKGKAPEAPLAAFVDDTAKRTGRAKAAVREELRIGELPEDVRATARETPVSNNKKELLALTRMPEEEQRRAVAAVKAGEAKSVRKRATKPASQEPSNDADAADCPFDLGEGAGEGGDGALIASASADPSGHRDDPMSPWASPGGALERELTRAQVVRLVGDAQRALAKAADLWPAEDGDGRVRLREATDAVERLARWMEAPAEAPWAETA